MKSKSWIVLFLVFVLSCSALCACGSVELDENEELSYQNALQLRDMLKDPDSFKLYDTMYVLKQYYDDGTLFTTYCVFEYGGTNSYGGMIKSTAIFENNQYIMDFDDDFDSLTDKQIVARAIVYLGDSVDNVERIDIDIQKIKDKMNLE